MKRFTTVCLVALCTILTTMARPKTVKLRVIQTTDVHGCFFPYDFINQRPKKGSMARVMTYVDSVRKQYGENLLLLDNGDILQGQPTCYYSNFVNPDMPNVAAAVINYMGFDAQTIGNHDIETGHAVYDKWIEEVKCPMLGANIINRATGKPYTEPYAIFNRQGVKIAVLGLLTPAIPNWLNEELWKGLKFEEMVGSAKYWVNHLKKTEQADIIIGLFHSGKDGGIHTDEYDEDASLRIAREVPGFDMVLFGHDHTKFGEVIKNVEGKDVLCMNASCNALMVCDASITVTWNEKRGKKTNLKKEISGTIANVENLKVDQDFMDHFSATIDSVNHFVNRKIGTFEKSIYSRDCYFGPSEFTDFIHDLQLKLTGADISFNAPLTFDSRIRKGDVHVSDMFNLYKYENQIYVVKMTGEEIRKHLEMSYDQWVATMKSPDDHIMLLNDASKDDQQRLGFKNLTFNFDSAAGIEYEVDVTRPNGEKVRILRMSNGEPFEGDKWYNVVMNSYRGNGGGELLTKGAGIPHHELKNRIVFESERDQRFYLMQEIEKTGHMDPQKHQNWKFVPQEWAKKAIERDKAIIFPHPVEEEY